MSIPGATRIDFKFRLSVIAKHLCLFIFELPRATGNFPAGGPKGRTI
jgi:hypothetical protein